MRAARPVTRPGSLWRNRDFTLLWGGQALSGLGGSMAGLAFPLIILSITGSAVLAGVVGTVALATSAVVGIPAGVLVDRVDRRMLMLSCDAIRLIAFAVLVSLLLTGHGSFVAVLVVAVVEALCDTPYSNASMASVRALVPADDVRTAVARNEARQYGVALAGPPLGGLLFGIARSLPFLVNAVSYVASAVALLLIRTPLQEERTPSAQSPLRDLGVGLRHVATTPALRATVMVAAPLNFALNGVIFGIVVVLRDRGVAAGLIGTVETIIGICGLLGAILAPVLMARVSALTLLRVICLLGVPLLLLVRPLAATPLAALPVGLLVPMGPALNSILFGHLAKTVPDALQGRVLSALMVATMSMTALAPIVIGTLVHHFGATGMVVGVASAMAVSVVVVLLSVGIREFGTLEEPSAV